MKPVKVRHPAIQVLLLKNVGRTTIDGNVPVSERFAGQRREIDLTPYLGEHGGVSVTKSVREPAGAFTVTLADRMEPEAMDTIYGLVEPMDLIEIRMVGDSYKSPQKVPIMMRGLVSNVHRHEGMTGDGKPARSVVIDGQDYGKIWQIIQIFHSPFVEKSANLITSFPFFARFGQAINTQEASGFVRDILSLVLNPYIEKIAQAGSGNSNSSPMMNIKPDGIEFTGGRIATLALGSWSGGTIYDLLQQNCDLGPWNELFIEDREVGPVMVFRPNPFIHADSNNGYIMERVSEPLFVKLTREDVVSMSVSRSDSNVANFFWVDAPKAAIGTAELHRLVANSTTPEEVYMKGYGNNNPDLYGIRRLEHATQQFDDEVLYSGNGLRAGPERDLSQSQAISWVNKRRKQLRDMNQDNVMFEAGSMRIRGNEEVRAGRYVTLAHGNMNSDYYAHTVQHDYVPFVGYTTTVQFERGTGFIDRTQQGGGKSSPYLSELGEK